MAGEREGMMVQPQKDFVDLLIEYYVLLSRRAQAWKVNFISMIENRPASREEAELLFMLAMKSRSRGRRMSEQIYNDGFDLKEINRRVRALEKIILARIRSGRPDAGSMTRARNRGPGCNRRIRHGRAGASSTIVKVLDAVFERDSYSNEEKRAVFVLLGHFYSGFVSGLDPDSERVLELGEMMSMLWPAPGLAMHRLKLFGPRGSLIRRGMIALDVCPMLGRAKANLSLSERMINLIVGDYEKRDSRCGMRDMDEEEQAVEKLATIENMGGSGRNGLLEMITPGIGLKMVVLPEDIRISIMEALCFHQSAQSRDLCDKMGINKSALFLFSGPPGTGKTITAQAVAKELGLTIGLVQYNNLIDMWYGGSEKNLANCFRQAQKQKVLLLFDEADALITDRRSARQGVIDQTEHRLKNIFLTEIERFEGIVVLTTNLAESLDQALERRLNLRVVFPIPDAGLRAKIWQNFLDGFAFLAPDINYEELAEKFPIAGGHIKNSVEKAVRRLFYLRQKNPEQMLDQKIILACCQMETDSMINNQRPKRAVGFAIN